MAETSGSAARARDAGARGGSGADGTARPRAGGGSGGGSGSAGIRGRLPADLPDDPHADGTGGRRADADGEGVGARSEVTFEGAVFVISVAAELAGMHPQTLRQYDRLGLVQPDRSAGGGRRYSPRDVLLLREIARLSHEEGVNLAGIKRIIELERRVDELQTLVAELRTALVDTEARLAEVRTPTTALVPLSQSVLAFWPPPPRSGH